MKKVYSNKKLKLIIMILIVALVIPITFVLSKYVVEKVQEGYFNSKKFYFNSYTLNDKVYDLYNWDGNSDYSFSVDTNNYKDKLSFTNEEISYGISLSCTYKGAPISCDSSGDDTISGSTLSNGYNTVKVYKGENQFKTGDVIKVIVKATSSSPYKKVLTSTFNLHINEIGISYSIIDKKDFEYFELIISNNLVDKEISVSYSNSNITVDNTNYFVKNGVISKDSNGKINQFSFNAVKGNVYSIRFYKNDTSVLYNIDDNIVEVR